MQSKELRMFCFIKKEHGKKLKLKQKQNKTKPKGKQPHVLESLSQNITMDENACVFGKQTVPCGAYCETGGKLKEFKTESPVEGNRLSSSVAYKMLCDTQQEKPLCLLCHHLLREMCLHISQRPLRESLFPPKEPTS